jgi:hypothetical protein
VEDLERDVMGTHVPTSDQDYVWGLSFWKFMNKVIISILIVLIITQLCVGFVTAQVQTSHQLIIDAINACLPANWTLQETKIDQIPWGHYWGWEDRYNGPKGYLMVFEGPADVTFNWRDVNGWHQKPLAKEILEVWIMPTRYRRSWEEFFNPSRPISAIHIFSGSIGKVYAHPTHRITSNLEFNDILKKAIEINWRTSPHNEGFLSWSTWQKDIKQQLEKLKN